MVRRRGACNSHLRIGRAAALWTGPDERWPAELPFARSPVLLAAVRDERDRGSRTVARVPSMRGELIRVGDTTVQFLVEGSDSGGSAAVFEAGIRARGRMPAPHSHDGFAETGYGPEGAATRTIDGTPGDGAPGEAGGHPGGPGHHFGKHG